MENNAFYIRGLEWFRNCLKDQELVDAIKNVTLVITDVDGSLTDGKMSYDEQCELARQFSIQDGFGIAKAQQSGISIAFLSGKGHQSVHVRAKKLSIPEDLCIGGPQEKLGVIKELLEKRGEQVDQVLFFGDDFLDAKVKMQEQKILYATPHNAPFYLQPLADIIIPRDGGDGAFRLLLDFVLFVQKKHFCQDLIEKSL